MIGSPAGGHDCNTHLLRSELLSIKLPRRATRSNLHTLHQCRGRGLIVPAQDTESSEEGSTLQVGCSSRNVRYRDRERWGSGRSRLTLRALLFVPGSPQTLLITRYI